MTFIVGAAATGAPGVSTALHLMAAQWPRPEPVPVLVEADDRGGVLAARFELSLHPGMVSLAESLRKFESIQIVDHAQRLPSGVAGVLLSPSAVAAATQLRSAGGFLGPCLRDSGHPVFLDVGTLRPDSQVAEAATAADLMLWFVRPTREHLLVLKHRLAETPQPDNVGIVLVGDVPYGAEQVSQALEVPVVHVLPFDRRAAQAVSLGGDDRYLRRSSLARSCSQLCEAIAHRLWVEAVQEPGEMADEPSDPPALVDQDDEDPDQAGQPDEPADPIEDPEPLSSGESTGEESASSGETENVIDPSGGEDPLGEPGAIDLADAIDLAEANAMRLAELNADLAPVTLEK